MAEQGHNQDRQSNHGSNYGDEDYDGDDNPDEEPVIQNMSQLQAGGADDESSVNK